MKIEEEDPEQTRKLADEIVKNTYRTLMTCSVRGYYAHTTNPGAEKVFERAGAEDVWV